MPVGGVEDACSWFSFSFTCMKGHGVGVEGQQLREAENQPQAMMGLEVHDDSRK